ncbi:N-acyl-D-amino-acid deacylase family protein [Allomuricauda sp. SCSIO 65647]|uniref:N-acyl-D-amino-acid deacylase family protein n=1 Tax=Allomuricauda sp. SCSIO 65647 TaxID=2908843 RepID=UPI001F30F353|nr:D-aminoacylase [Muricauda sp. SCSIO 65647]UJH67333.1 D-aminoacylase [Muricauda sp. SCSIO 65647]
MRMTAILAVFVLLASCQPEVQYDIVLKNGIIYDGNGGSPFSADIGINGDTIATIAETGALSGTEVVDVNGLAVAPGFINMLSWANVSLLEDGRSQSDIRQGVTLEVMGEGRSMGPLSADMKQEMLNNQGDIKFDVPWMTLGEYLQYLEDKGVSTNVTSFVGNGTLRRHVIGYENRPATAEELEKMKQLTAQAMEEGAVGISSSLLYAPSMYASTEELIELAKVSGEHNGMYISHIRNEGDQLLESLDELIHIGKEADVRAEVYHLKASAKHNWNKLDVAIEKIDSARNAGLDITADIYTYNASSTGLHVQLPDWAREGGIAAMLERLADPANRKKAIGELEFRNAPETILLVGFRTGKLRKYIGKYLPEVAQELGKSVEETLVDLIVEDGSRIQVVYFSMSEDNIKKKLAQPWVSICSDAGSYTNEGVFVKQSTHPRAYGSFIRVLGKFARDEGVISLEEGIRRMTSLPAENLKLIDRGRLAEGYFADIVVFDPKKVNDKATFTDPHQYAEGVVHVFVNGGHVLKDGEHTGATPGRFVKGPGYIEKKNDKP